MRKPLALQRDQMSGAEGVGRVLEGALGGVQSEAEDRAWGRVDHRCREAIQGHLLWTPL